MLLGEKLKVVRNKIGMSQNEVAENLRISRQTVSKWENNYKYSPNGNMFFSIHLVGC